MYNECENRPLAVLLVLTDLLNIGELDIAWLVYRDVSVRGNPVLLVKGLYSLSIYNT